jgi:hypothetical protein
VLIKFHGRNRTPHDDQLNIMPFQQFHRGKNIGQALALSQGTGEQDAKLIRTLKRTLRGAVRSIQVSGRGSKLRNKAVLVLAHGWGQRLKDEKTGANDHVGQGQLLGLPFQLREGIARAHERRFPLREPLPFFFEQLPDGLPVGNG